MAKYVGPTLVLCLATILAGFTTDISFGQFEGVEASVTEAPAEAATADSAAADGGTEMIALTLWTLTVSESSDPETDELTGELLDKASDLPAVVGTRNDVGKLVGRLKAAGLLRKSRVFRLMTLNGHRVEAQFGMDEPMVQGISLSEFGRTNNIMYRQTGTIIRATPVIGADGTIQVSHEYNATQMEESDTIAISEPKNGNPMFASVIPSRRVEGTVRLKSGNAVLVSSDERISDTGESKSGETQLIILAATVVPLLSE